MNGKKKRIKRNIQANVTKPTAKKRCVFARDPLPSCTGKAIVAIRKTLQVTQPEFAKILGVSVQSIKAWETEKSKPSVVTQRLLYLFEKDISLVYELVRIQECEETRPNPTHS